MDIGLKEKGFGIVENTGVEPIISHISCKSR